jgi:hypothetical protein
VPAPPSIKRAEEVTNAQEYAGSYRSAAGELLFRSRGPRLLLTIEGKEVVVQKQDDDVFLIPHPRFERLLLTFHRGAGAPVAAWWGETCFRKDSTAAKPDPTGPNELGKMAGYYPNNDPWAEGFAVFARGHQLWLDGTRPLIPLPDGAYRVGAGPAGCERVRFEAPLNGRPQRAFFSGVAHDRDSTDIPGLFGNTP